MIVGGLEPFRGDSDGPQESPWAKCQNSGRLYLLSSLLTLVSLSSDLPHFPSKPSPCPCVTLRSMLHVVCRGVNRQLSCYVIRNFEEGSSGGMKGSWIGGMLLPPTHTVNAATPLMPALIE